MLRVPFLYANNRYMIVFLLSLVLVCVVAIILSSIAIGATSYPIKVRLCEMVTQISNASSTEYWEIKLEFSNRKIDYTFYSKQLHNVSRIAIIGAYDPQNGWDTTKTHINILYKPYIMVDDQHILQGSAKSEYVNGTMVHPVLFNKKVDEIIQFPPRYSLLIATDVGDIQIQLKDSC